MIYWAPFLHFYQPPIQFHAVLKKICNESYRPLVKLFSEHPNAKATINICGVLTELLNDHGAGDIIDGMRKIAENGQFEFVDSAKYHAILPLIPKEEMKIQIKLNERTNSYFFKESYKPRGFFFPEMCYSNEAAGVVRSLGYDWVLISGVACQTEWPLDFISSVSLGSSTINVFFRDDVISNKISFRDLDSVGFIKNLTGLAGEREDIYVITAMDAETFGHHIRDWDKLFLEVVYETIDKIEDFYHDKSGKKEDDLAGVYKKIFADLEEIPHIEVVTISELLDKFSSKKVKAPKPSSWSTTKDDIARKNYYPLWKDVSSRIHDLQWEHLNICFELIEQVVKIKSSDKESNKFAILSRSILDRAIYSCQFWWANKSRGMWKINLINKGLMMQEEALLNACKAMYLSSSSGKEKKEFNYKAAACREIAVKIREILVTE